MMKLVRRFLPKLLVAIVCACISWSSFAVDGPNLPMGDIGDYGNFATEYNIEEIKSSLKKDLTQIGQGIQKQLVRDYVPLEARLGLAMMNGITSIAKVLDASLVRFMIIFIIVMYLFWIMFESYNFMLKGGGDVTKFLVEVVKKGGWIIIWLAILHVGPAKLFVSAMIPIVSLGAFISDFILNAISAISGAVLPDTCGAIQNYAVANAVPDMLIDATAAAKLMCIPTRLSGFFTSAIAMGWNWMVNSVGYSMFGFVMGAIFTVIFAWNTWKFALMALGVIMDLFLGILLLPFTAFAETITPTSYKGLAGNIFNGFIKLFNAGPVKLNLQVNRFINAAIYFVALSIVIAICAALLYGIIGSDMASQVPSLDNDGFIPALLTGALVAYLANQADDIAKNIGGLKNNDIDSSFGDKFGQDIKTLASDTYKVAKDWAKAIAESKK